MGETTTRLSVRDRIRWWLFEKCFAYCIRMVHPDADPAEFCFLDTTSFIAVSKDDIRAIIEDAPDLAWRFTPVLAEMEG